MLGQSILEGFRLIRSRFRLVVLIYALNLLLVLAVAFPVYRMMMESVGATGFGKDLLLEFDILLWREIIIENRDSLLQLLWTALFAIPVFWVWKTAVQMGTIYALHHGAMWSFWPGVFAHTWQGLIVGLCFLPLKAAWVVLTILGASVFLSSLFYGEVAAFWVMAVGMPIVLLSGLAILELYQRYARLALVIRNSKVVQALKVGFVWPGRHSVISLVYICWYIITIGVFLLSVSVNAELHVGTSYVLFALVIQQVIMMGRAAVTVGWVGSEVFLFENTSTKKDARPVKSEQRA